MTTALRRDMRLLAEAGLTAYRFGIEWARVEPLRGAFSLAELAHNRRMIDTGWASGSRRRGRPPG